MTGISASDWPRIAATRDLALRNTPLAQLPDEAGGTLMTSSCATFLLRTLIVAAATHLSNASEALRAPCSKGILALAADLASSALGDILDRRAKPASFHCRS